MIINLCIDTEELEVGVEVPQEYAKNFTKLWIVDKILIAEIKDILPRLQKELRKVKDNDKS